MFEVKQFDRYIEVEMSAEKNISYLKCPTCKRPIQKTRRYFPEIRRRMADIEAIKARIIANDIANEGVVKYQAGKHFEAKKLFIRASDLDPTNTDILIKLARSSLALSQFAEASSTLDKLLIIDPTHNEAKAMLGNCNEERFKQEIVKAMSSEIKKGGAKFHLKTVFNLFMKRWLVQMSEWASLHHRRVRWGHATVDLSRVR